jgi:hypothetical protein
MVLPIATSPEVRLADKQPLKVGGHAILPLTELQVRAGLRAGRQEKLLCPTGIARKRDWVDSACMHPVALLRTQWIYPSM